MTKVQLSLTPEEAAILIGYGDQFGYSLPKTIKFMISKATESVVRSGSLPVYDLPDSLEKRGLQALKEHRAGKTSEVKNFAEYFDSI
ncbi:hypothetical protein A3B02_02270 [Candidatus Roizmanbacteria bacterium RIFCSPLOWO2_01_FULL_42_14]|uniref:Uncharacterized protein n=3 Tax=Candidatus Roizmaniibacteriota TaxID=1752723 RepID=A0A1F7JXG7_9BACT|nr:MAG: hypothetical protein A3D08_01185 [Candidatus Roizmanbacteria bacterium RIFCSPHIGHO2_02_FULL_43_11]OGK51948.1 MAG: hypothetical protein A3B02_02270 [Candidatus Roizmanbacteria bacterium RIFCSPLOWO2_01_FULL_42_14]OGK60297.1 MAG: hypothetical protein A3I56_04365 [Candidatus Roizmanbacteria bacterium RIFCSPLOWO2_02_FULL_43_10]